MKFYEIIIRIILNSFILGEADRLSMITECPTAIRFIRNPEESVQLATVGLNPTLIHLIKNPTHRVQAFAVSLDSTVITMIQNPDDDIKMLAKLGQ